MASKSPDSHSGSPTYNNKYDKYFYQNNTKTIQRKPIFAPILEEPGDILNNLQDLNTSSIPMGANNNNSSFENSINGIHLGDYHTMNKFRPSLNLSGLPPVFEIPQQKVATNNNLNNNNVLNITNNQSMNNNSIYYDKNNLNIKLMRGSRLNLKPIMNNSNVNTFNNTAGGNNNITNNKNAFISLPPINSHTNYNKLKDIKNENQNNYNISNNYNNTNNNINNSNNNNALNIRNYQQRKKQYLKPIQMGKSLPYKNNLGSSNNIHEVRRTLDVNRDNNNNLNRNKNQGKYYYNLNNKNIIKSEKLKEERALRNKEMSNISINQNRNYVDKNIVILNNKDSNITHNYKSNPNVNNNYLNNANINEFVSINKNNTRVIHIPTLKIYDRFDIPSKNYIFYENYIKNWRKMMRGTIEIKNIIENNDTNYYHIIIERSKNGSLGNIIRSIGSINEYLIMVISKQIIPLIKIYNNIFDYRLCEMNEQLYNYIDMDNIWFNAEYNVILYPGKLSKNKKAVNNNLQQFLIKLYNLSNNNDIIIKEKNEENTNLQLNMDLMNYGITLININIYILDLTVNDLFELINNIDSINNNDYCCLFHFFYNNIKLFSNHYDSLKQSNEYKENYFDFLHHLTSFKFKEKNYETIINHSFVNNTTNINIYSNINELIKVGKMYDFSNEYYTSNSNIISFDLISNKIRKNLENFGFFYEYYNISDTKTLFNMNNIEIEELCKELKVNYEELHEKLLIKYQNFLEHNQN